MKINDKLTFGKYCGLTILEVFQGPSEIDKDLIEQYLSRQIEGVDPRSYGQKLIHQIFSFEISDTLIRATPLFDTDLSKDFTKIFSSIFKSDSVKFDRSLGEFTPFQDFIGWKRNDMGEKQILTACGNPDYIDWCIKKVKGFYIDPQELVALEDYLVFRYRGIDVKHQIDDIYTYVAENEFSEYSFPISTIQINQSKAGITPGRYFREISEDSTSNLDRDYFDAMTDGQLGSYDDFKGSLDQLDDWSGR